MDDKCERTSLPERLLRAIQDLVRNADAAKQAGEALKEVDARNKLGLLFEESGMLPHAARAYQCCLDVAERVSWADGELASYLALGTVMHKQGMLHDALRHYEAHLALATANGAGPDVLSLSQRRIVAVHSALAEVAARSGAGDEARSHLDACLRAARAAGDGPGAAAVLHQLGRLAQREGKWEEAIHLQHQYIKANAEAGSRDSATVAEAYFCLAECHEASGSPEEAMAALELHMNLSRLAEPEAHAKGYCKFGTLCFSSGKLDQAIMYFEKFFEVTKSVGDRRALEVARINLGVARAAAARAQFFGIVENNMEALLSWKSMRVPFCEQA